MSFSASAARLRSNESLSSACVVAGCFRADRTLPLDVLGSFLFSPKKISCNGNAARKGRIECTGPHRVDHTGRYAN